MKRFIHKACPFIIPIAIALIIVVLFRTVFFIGYVPTESMEPTLEADSMIFGIRCFGELHKGNIIIFKHEGSYLVKRIAACECDTVEHNGQQILVPKGCVYVLGDNAENSHDSRYWEDPFVKETDVVAKVILLQCNH